MLMDITSIVLQRKKTEGGKVSSFSFPFYSSFVPPTKVFCQRPFQLKKLLNSRVPKLQRSDHSKQFYLSLILLQKATFKAIYSLLKQVGEAHTKNLIRTPSSSSTSICFILQVAEFALAVVAMMYVRAEHTIAKPTFVVVSARFRFRTSRLQLQLISHTSWHNLKQRYIFPGCQKNSLRTVALLEVNPFKPESLQALTIFKGESLLDRISMDPKNSDRNTSFEALDSFEKGFIHEGIQL